MEKEVLSITVRDHFGLPFVLLLVVRFSMEIINLTGTAEEGVYRIRRELLAIGGVLLVRTLHDTRARDVHE